MKAEPQPKSRPVPAAPVQPAAGRLLQRKCACGGSPGADGECAACRKKRLQRQAGAGGRTPVVPPIVHDVLGSAGRPLATADRAFMESRLGHDFSRVRVHTDAQAARSARAVDALAYTVGSHVVFDEGRYAPGSPDGRRLLAHELAHVIQQGGGTFRPAAISPPDDPTERAADAVADLALAAGPGASGAPPSPAPGAGRCQRLQRVVNERKVGCRADGIPSLGLTGDDAVAAIRDANEEAIRLCQLAESNLFVERLTYSPATVDANFATILLEELGLDMANPRHRELTEVIERRFELVRTRVLESDYTGYTCLGAASITLARGTPHEVSGDCCTGTPRACSAGGVSHIVLCRPWWTERVDLRPGTLVHEPMHVYFDLDDFSTKLNDAHCYTAFVQRLAGITPLVTCAGR
jgi:hypothetical protein